MSNNWNTTGMNEEVSANKYLTHGLHIVTLREVKKSDWTGGNALDAFFVDDKNLEYKHRIFEFKGNPGITKRDGTPFTEEDQWKTYLGYIKHIFSKCFKHAEASKFDTLMSKVTNFDSLVTNLNSLSKLNTKMQIKLSDDGKGYAKFPKYINKGFCDWVDAPQYTLTFDASKEGRKEKPSNTENPNVNADGSVNEVMPWDVK